MDRIRKRKKRVRKKGVHRLRDPGGTARDDCFLCDEEALFDVGCAAFKDWVKSRFDRLEQLREIPEAQMLAVTPQEIMTQVCDYYNLDECMLKKSRRGTENLPRDIAISLSRCYSRKTLADIGSAFGIDNYSTVSSAVERIKLRKSQDNHLQQGIAKLETVVTKKPTAYLPPF